jgi:hypothetical protein
MIGSCLNNIEIVESVIYYLHDKYGLQLLSQCMDKLQLKGQNLGQVFNFRSGHLHAATFLVLSVELPNLQLKTQPKKHLGSLPLVIALPTQCHQEKVLLQFCTQILENIAIEAQTIILSLMSVPQRNGKMTRQQLESTF